MLGALENDTREVAKGFSQTVGSLRDLIMQLEVVTVKNMEVLAQSSMEARSTIERVTNKARILVDGICSISEDVKSIGVLENKIRSVGSNLTILESLVNRSIKETEAKKKSQLTPEKPKR
uniref:Uncharacterized protein n=1 Tax=Amorphochlora amoebiformis TaxID=1561963 RepID=A0A7S0DLC7_9EUKA